MYIYTQSLINKQKIVVIPLSCLFLEVFYGFVCSVQFRNAPIVKNGDCVLCGCQLLCSPCLLSPPHSHAGEKEQG